MVRLLELVELPIRVDARGRWLHGDEPLHPRVQRLFAQHIEPSPQGKYFVVLGPARQEIVVHDTPYWVRRVSEKTDAQGRLAGVELVLSDGRQDTLNPETLMQGDDNALYCRIARHGLWVPCRFTQGQYHALALQMEIDDGYAVLPLAGHAYRIGAFRRQPTRVAAP